MKDITKSPEIKEQDTAYKLKLAKKTEKRANFVREMNASSTFGKLFVWLKHKWVTSILFWIMLMVLGTFIIIAGRILWEVAKMVFNLSL